MAQLKTDIESLATREALNFIPGGVQSTAGTSLIANQSATIAADEEVLFIASGTCSASSTATIIFLQARIDGVAQYGNYKTDLVVGTGGLSDTWKITCPAKNLSAGSHTFEVNMVVSGGGTGYVANMDLLVTCTKRRT